MISEVDLAHRSAAVQVDVQTEGVADGETVELRIFGADDEDSQHAGGAACQTVRAAVRDNHARGSFHLDPVRLWEGLADPYLYTAEAVLISEGEAGDEDSVLDAVGTRFGVRSFRVDPVKGFFLNGRPYPLRGVSRHQDRLGVGNAITPAMMEEDMTVIRDIGANSLRLAHYQQAQAFYDLCDENGILVWAEIPFITKFMEKGIQNTLDQMRELITQSSNHPSIYCWGLSNEITASSPVTEELMENHTAGDCPTRSPPAVRSQRN